MLLAKVVNKTRCTVVGENIEVADSSLTRLWGLLGRSRLEGGGGLWIKPSSGVHTVGMRFPIDVVGLDGNLRVMRLWTNLLPNRLTPISFRIKSVIELPAGRVVECQIHVGDALQICKQHD